MATLDSLPGDQRAVLQLVLGRGRSYEEIARVLTIEPGAVRDRALAALDALGPPADLSAADRAAVADYLLGQLTASDAESVRDRLAREAGPRDRARALRDALAPLSPRPLPPVPSTPAAAPPAPAAPAASSAPSPQAAAPRVAPSDASPPPVAPPPAPEAKRSSRLGGAIVIAVTVLVIAAIAVIVLRHHHRSPAADRSAATPAASSGTTSSTTATSTSSTAKPIAQINLRPTASGSKAVAIGFVYAAGGERELVIEGQKIPANTAHSSYEVWLYNSESDAKSLGFVNPGVSSSGRLSTVSPLPSNAGRYRELIITTETADRPSRPGQIAFSGQLSGL